MTFMQYYRQLNMIFFGVLVAPFLYSPVAVYLIEGSFGSKVEYLNAYNTTVLAASILAIVMSFVFFGHYKQQARDAESIEVKLKTYRKGLLYFFLIMEAALVLSLVAAFVTSKNYFLIASGILSILIILRKPRARSMLEGLKFTDQQIKTVVNEME